MKNEYSNMLPKSQINELNFNTQTLTWKPHMPSLAFLRITLMELESSFFINSWL